MAMAELTIMLAYWLQHVHTHNHTSCYGCLELQICNAETLGYGVAYSHAHIALNLSLHTHTMAVVDTHQELGFDGAAD